MSKKSDETLSEIEEAQSALRDSIETAKELAERSDELIKRHRQQIEDEAGGAASSTPA